MRSTWLEGKLGWRGHGAHPGEEEGLEGSANCASHEGDHEDQHLGMLMPQVSILRNTSDLSFLFTAMKNMQTDKPNFLFMQDQLYHPSHLFSEHTARVFLLYSSPLA